jgi:hypothetical protein
MEFKHVVHKFLYRIETKPGGGFIAYSKDPSLPPIEGATRTEVEQKIQESIGADLGSQFPELKPLFEGQQVKLSYHIEPKPGGGYMVRHGDSHPDESHPDESAHEPIEGSTREHVESLIESKLLSAIMKQFPPEVQQQLTDKINSGGLDVTVNRKVSVTTKVGGVPGKTPSLEPNTSFSPSAGTAPEILPPGEVNQSPITYEKSNRGPILRFVLFLLFVFALVYVFLHRR